MLNKYKLLCCLFLIGCEDKSPELYACDVKIIEVVKEGVLTWGKNTYTVVEDLGNGIRFTVPGTLGKPEDICKVNVYRDRKTKKIIEPLIK